MEKIKSLFIVILIYGCIQKPDEVSEKPLFKISENLIQTFSPNQKELSVLCPKSNGYRRVILFSSAHAGYLVALGLEKKVVGISNKSYFYHPYFQSPEIQSLGDLEQVDIEKLLKLQPDLVLLPPSMQLKNLMPILKKEKIDFLVLNEYQSSSPIAQAEWIKVFGKLFGKSAAADSIFSSVSENYQNIRNRCQSKKMNIVVLSGLPWQGKWYVSGQNGYWNQMLNDAGAQYFYPKTAKDGEYLSSEQVIKYAQNTTHWLNIGIASELKNIENQLNFTSHIPPYISGKCYNQINQVNNLGANNYWELGIVYPDSILMDLEQVFYNPSFEKGIYYKKLK